MATSAHSVEIMNALVRQYSEGSHAPLQGLPVLVDVQELIARHRREHGSNRQAAETGLPPVSSQDVMENKLPTYEECNRHGMEVACGHRGCSGENETNSRNGKPYSEAFTFRSSFDRTQRDVDHGNKMLGESNVYFENVSETLFLNEICEGRVADRFECPQIREGVEAEEPEDVIENTEGREWVEEPRVIECTDVREWVREGKSQVIVNTERREWMGEGESHATVNTDRREWIEEQERRVIVETEIRESVGDAELHVIGNTENRDLAQDAESRVIVETEFRECVGAAELHVIGSTENRGFAQEVEPYNMEVKAGIRKYLGENNPQDGLSNTEARGLTETAEAEEAVAPAEITGDYLMHRTTNVKASKGAEGGEVKQEINEARIGEEIRSKEGRKYTRDTQIDSGIEAAETGWEIGGSIKLGGITPRREKSENLEHVSDIGIRGCVTVTTVEEVVENKEVQHDKEILEQTAGAETTENTTDTDVRDLVRNLQAKPNSGSNGNEIISGIREENGCIETREKIEDAKIREGIIVTEKREGIGDMETIPKRWAVNTTKAQNIDKEVNRESKNITASIYTRDKIVEREIKVIIHSEMIRDKEPIICLENTERGECVNDVIVEKGQLETQMKQNIVISESEEKIEVIEKIKSIAGTKIEGGRIDDGRKGGVSKNEAADAEISDRQWNEEISKRQQRGDTTRSHTLFNDVASPGNNLTYQIEEVNKNADFSSQANSERLNRNENLAIMADCDVVGRSLSDNLKTFQEEDEIQKSKTASLQENVKIEHLSVESSNL